MMIMFDLDKRSAENSDGEEREYWDETESDLSIIKGRQQEQARKLHSGDVGYQTIS